jgi:hypothetical protein
MNYAETFGSHLMQGRVWAPPIELSGPDVGMVSGEAMQVDQYLSAIGTDPFDPAAVIAIGAGRFVSIGNAASVNGGTNGYRVGQALTGLTPLTLHDGNNLTPVGMATNQMYKQMNGVNMFMTESNTVKFRRGFVAEVPYVSTINDAHGTLVAGDRVTGYWGSTTTTSPTTLHRGKPVKWFAKKLYHANAASTGLVGLASAIYPGITPRIVLARTGATFVATSATALSWNQGLGYWTASFSSNVTDVDYEFGQDGDQIAGEVLRIESLSNILTTHPFQKWVEYAQRDYINFPAFGGVGLATQRMPIVEVGTGTNPADGSGWETPSTVTANVSYRVATYPMSINHPVLIAIQGTVIDTSGYTTTYSGSGASSWFILPVSAIQDYRGYFIGLYHTVNARTGLIEFAANITSVTAIRALYSYIADPRDGASLWGGGILGLTDGANVPSGGVPQYGTPAHLNVAGGTGALRVIVR